VLCSVHSLRVAFRRLSRVAPANTDLSAGSSHWIGP
jgi:hypothetical protein